MRLLHLLGLRSGGRRAGGAALMAQLLPPAPEVAVMRRVWKYAVPVGSETTIEVGGRIVHVGVQGSWPMLWIEVDPSPFALKSRTFRAFATGEPIPDGWQHCGTVQDPPFVWHVYERLP